MLSIASLAAALVDTDLFIGGTGGYYCYRLPNLVQLPTPGHLLAVAQGHKYDCYDGGWTDVVAKSSTDNGRTWSMQRLIHTESVEGVKNVTVGTPSAVADLKTGAVYLFVAVMWKTVLLLKSGDAGLSWDTPRDMTAALVPSSWRGIYTGLPQGIQLDSGRLIICANHKYADESTKSHTIYSDDHGATWRNGQPVGPSHMGECSVAEGAAGVFLYARVWWDDQAGAATWRNSTRGLAFSSDGGASFEEGDLDAFPGNPMRDCQGAMIIAGAQRDTFLAAGPWGADHFPRVNYTVLASRAGADGKPTAWAPLRGADPLWRNTSQYSTLMWPRAEPETFFVLHERGGDYNPDGSVPPGGRVGDAVLHLTQLRLPVW